MDPIAQQIIEGLQRDIANLQSQMGTHYHGGYDSSQVAWSNLFGRKLYIDYTIPGTSAATSANYSSFWIAPAACLLTFFKEVHQTAGTDAGAVTLDLEKLTGTTAPGSGTTMFSSTLSLKATANTVQTATLTGTNANKTLAAGDRIALKSSGTLTAVANVTALLEIQLI